MRRGLGGEVLRVLRDAGPQTKNQLADGLGIPRTTLNASVRGLADAGHVEDGPVVATGGRRSVTVRIASGRRFLVLSMGETAARVAVLDGQLTIASGVTIDLQDRDPDTEWLAYTVCRAAQRLLGTETPAAVGVAVADVEPVVDAAVVARLASAYPGRPLATVSSVRALALGERRQGGASAADDFVAVRLGRSVTAATVAGGSLVLGSTGRSGEIGHLRVEEFGPACACGLTGCLDSFVSSGALVAQATSLARRGRSSELAQVLERAGTLDLRDLVVAGRAGDAVVAQVARELGQRLGRVVAGLVAHGNPRRVVVGGPVAAVGPSFLGDLRATVYRLAPPSLAQGLDITLSDPDGRADLIGCASAAMTRWIEQDL
jgi:predicted NBD/HSP70 family sugar kinase